MSNQAQVQNLYSHNIANYHAFVEKVKYKKALSLFLQKYLRENKKTHSVLDAGCGSGIVTQALYESAEKNYFNSLRITGFDVTPSMLVYFASWIKKNNYKNITLVKTDVLQLDTSEVKQNNFDLVLSSGMMEYLDKKNFPQGLKQLYQTIKPGGKMLLFISKKSVLNFFLIQLWWKAHIYSTSELKNAFETAGFKDITFHKFPQECDHMNRWGTIVEGRK